MKLWCTSDDELWKGFPGLRPNPTHSLTHTHCSCIFRASRASSYIKNIRRHRRARKHSGFSDFCGSHNFRGRHHLRRFHGCRGFVHFSKIPSLSRERYHVEPRHEGREVRFHACKARRTPCRARVTTVNSEDCQMILSAHDVLLSLRETEVHLARFPRLT